MHPEPTLVDPSQPYQLPTDPTPPQPSYQPEATWGTSAGEPDATTQPAGGAASPSVDPDPDPDPNPDSAPTNLEMQADREPQPLQPEPQPQEECTGGECLLTDPASDSLGTTQATGPAAATWGGDGPGTWDARASTAAEPTAYDAQSSARSPNPRSPARSPARAAARASRASHHPHPAERSPGIRRRRAQ